ncbi:FAD-dependent oxidoreductase [Longispora sp. K20-0274]|uniref:FAD-dependent oxidoreductase n=1 Tax=Longispora sp. K20-0274 TaxID=3088255 RepID=UPI00399A4EC1
MTRVAVVGGGVAGALLAWRLHTGHPSAAEGHHPDPEGHRPDPEGHRPVPGGHRPVLDVFVGARPGPADASGASGGLVRGYEPDPAAAAIAAASLAELRADPVLRAWAGYREVGCAYLLPPGADPGPSVRVVADLLPGSIEVGAPPAAFHTGGVAVTERHAGHLSPAALRAAVLAHLVDAGVAVRAERVTAVAPGEVRTAGGTTSGYDAVVVAAGAWTPRLLAASGLDVMDLRTKQIQFTVYDATVPGLGTFVDTATGLYGRPVADGLLLGLHCDRWDVDPDATVADEALAARIGPVARDLFGDVLGRPIRTVASFDCYHPEPGLALRTSAPGLYTFTGGSGGAAKTVLAASATAARELSYRATQEV